jgi:chromosome segregation ATPase
MIDSPNENTKLTFDQLQQIDVTQKQLANLQGEITNAIKTLKGIKMEIERATAERKYQEQLFAELEPKIKEAQSHHSLLITDIENGKKTLNETYEKVHVLEDEYKKKSDSLDENINKHRLDVEEHQKKVEEHNAQITKLESDKLAVKSAKDAFSKVIEGLPW